MTFDPGRHRHGGRSRFHVWPDRMAQQVEAAYQSFAENAVEVDMQEEVA